MSCTCETFGRWTFLTAVLCNISFVALALYTYFTIFEHTNPGTGTTVGTFVLARVPHPTIFARTKCDSVFLYA
tara:strand:- start:5129 stop:5347 length:219 start_codon:yes stop_codon:yes gene_type:complete